MAQTSHQAVWADMQSMKFRKTCKACWREALRCCSLLCVLPCAWSLPLTTHMSPQSSCLYYARWLITWGMPTDTSLQRLSGRLSGHALSLPGINDFLHLLCRVKPCLAVTDGLMTRQDHTDRCSQSLPHLARAGLVATCIMCRDSITRLCCMMTCCNAGRLCHLLASSWL